MPPRPPDDCPHWPPPRPSSKNFLIAWFFLACSSLTRAVAREVEVGVREVPELHGGALLRRRQRRSSRRATRYCARFGHGADDVVAVLVALAFPFLSAVVGDLGDENLRVRHGLSLSVEDLALNTARLREGGRCKGQDGERAHTRSPAGPLAEFSGKHSNPPKVEAVP